MYLRTTGGSSQSLMPQNGVPGYLSLGKKRTFRERGKLLAKPPCRPGVFGTRSSSLEIIFGRCAGSVDRSKCLLLLKSFSVREPHRVMVVKAQLQFVGDPLLHVVLQNDFILCDV